MMKNIIVPTDFSPNSKNALHFAINFANHFEAKIHLLHIYKVQSKAGMLMNIRDFMRRDAEEQLALMVKEVQNSLFHGAALEAKALEGYTIDTICAYANSIEDSLLIMGTQGAGALEQIFMGTNASGVMKKSDRPALFIPSAYQYQTLKNITLAVDAEVLNSPEVLNPLTTLVETYRARFHILHIEKKEELIAVDIGIKKYLEPLKPSYYLISGPLSVKEEIDRFVETSKTNLLCMIRRERSLLGQLFHSSTTLKEVFECKVPLLIIKD